MQKNLLQGYFRKYSTYQYTYIYTLQLCRKRAMQTTGSVSHWWCDGRNVLFAAQKTPLPRQRPTACSTCTNNTAMWGDNKKNVFGVNKCRKKTKLCIPLILFPFWWIRFFICCMSDCVASLSPVDSRWKKEKKMRRNQVKRICTHKPKTCANTLARGITQNTVVMTLSNTNTLIQYVIYMRCCAGYCAGYMYKLILILTNCSFETDVNHPNSHLMYRSWRNFRVKKYSCIKCLC